MDGAAAVSEICKRKVWARQKRPVHKGKVTGVYFGPLFPTVVLLELWLRRRLEQKLVWNDYFLLFLDTLFGGLFCIKTVLNTYRRLTSFSKADAKGVCQRFGDKASLLELMRFWDLILRKNSTQKCL